MCGISGQINLRKDKALSEQKVTAMLNTISHRGPDENGYHNFDDAIIANARLVIVGRETGKQPHIESGHGLVFNGEIYNYKELLDIDSDTVVLFELLEKNGMKSLPILNGVFSFAYVNDDSIFLVRDRFGEKPLYYTIIDHQLYFASEIKAFRDFCSYIIDLPPEYSALETCAGKNTIFKGIYQVEAGCYMKINRKNGSMSSHRYYCYEPSQSSGSPKEQASQLKSLVEDAVKLRTPSDLPYGVYISGGLDSSIVTMASQPTNLLTYIPESNYVPNEEKYADIVAGAKPKSLYLKKKVSENRILLEMINSIYSNDGPTTTLAAYSQYILSREANRTDLRVVLGGMGADEFFNGYVRHAVAYLPPNSLNSQTRIQYKSQLDKIKGRGNSYNDIARSYAKLLNRSPEPSDWLSSKVEEIFNYYQEPLMAMSVCDANFTLPPLLNTDDRLNMAHGVESRNPLLDYRIVDFALSLPPDRKIFLDKHGPDLKHILREAFKDLLPPQIYNRKDKVGFSSNLIDLLQARWSPLVINSIELLQNKYPDEPYFFQKIDEKNKYSRWPYQMLQLAITHLLFCENKDPLDIYTELTQKARLPLGL